MAFWGAKVKAGKPYTLVHDGESTGEGRRLRITQATLARRNYSKTSERSILECRVGSRKPVIVCSLAPNRLDSISLDLEFHEKEAVVFYVKGSVAIHLAGYIPANKYEEEIGEDIQETESDRSEQFDDNEDNDLSDFVVDDDVVEYNTTASSGDDDTTCHSKKRPKKLSSRPSIASNLEAHPKFSKKKKTKDNIAAKESENSDNHDIVKSFFGK